jgi:N-acylneuraminate cytidylyltransferase
MTKNVPTLAVIPARSGSQGVPGKNIKPLGGHPMMAWTIAASLACPAITRTVVTTDSEEYADIARAYGAEVPFLRPPLLSGPKATTEDTVLHAVTHYEENENFHPEWIIILQPTSPIRLPGTLDRAFERLEQEKLDSLISVYQSHHFHWRDSDPPEALFDYAHRPMRQDMKKEDHLYGETGLFYIIRTETFKKLHCRLGGKIGIFPLHRAESVEVDTPEDFQVIEAFMKIWKAEIGTEPKKK